jgi:uncharacterized paraquat-inducible protein A
MPKLVTCKSCEAQISTNAAYSYYCPHCGHIYRRTFFQTYRRFLWMMLALLVVGFGYALIAS